MSLLEQNTIKKRWMAEKIIQMGFDISNNSGKYKEETIWDSAIHTKKLKLCHLSDLYYWVS